MLLTYITTKTYSISIQNPGVIKKVLPIRSNCTGCNQRRKVIHDYLKIGDFTLFQGYAEMYFKAKTEKREFHNWRDIRVNVYV